MPNETPAASAKAELESSALAQVLGAMLAEAHDADPAYISRLADRLLPEDYSRTMEVAHHLLARVRAGDFSRR